MSPFVVSSWIACLLTLLVLFWTLVRARQLFLKPSIIFVSFFHLQLQWSSTLQAKYIESFLMRPWDYFYLAQVFPLSLLLLSLLVGRRTAKRVYSGLRPMPIASRQDCQEQQWLLAPLLIFIALVFGWYLAVVPPRATGLYALVFSLPNAELIREKSFKLLNNPFLTYSFALMANTLAPLAAVLLAFKANEHLFHFHPLNLAFYIAWLCFVLIAVSIYGMKVPAVMVLLSIALAFLLRAGLSVRLGLIALVGLLILIVPTGMSIFVTHGRFTTEGFVHHYIYILDRVFRQIMFPGLWHVDFAQRQGYFGIAGIPKIAKLIGVEPVNSFHVIAEHYMKNEIESASAGTSFVFAYYSYFGLLAFVPCLIVTLLLDTLLWVYLKMDRDIKIPVIACCSVAVINLVQTRFTTVLFTGGLIPLILVGVVWTAFIRNVRSRQARRLRK